MPEGPNEFCIAQERGKRIIRAPDAGPKQANIALGECGCFKSAACFCACVCRCCCGRNRQRHRPKRTRKADEGGRRKRLFHSRFHASTLRSTRSSRPTPSSTPSSPFPV